MKILGQFLAATAIASLALAAACKSETAPPDSPPGKSGGEADPMPTPDATSEARLGGTVEGVRDGEPIDSGTIGGDGSDLRIDPLTNADVVGANLRGELGCSFTKTGDNAPLLLAKGDVASSDRALAAVRFAGIAERMVSTEDGGFDAIVDGGRFATRGLTIDIRRGKAPMPGATGESPPYPAAMRAMRADGAERDFKGTWTCGP